VFWFVDISRKECKRWRKCQFARILVAISENVDSSTLFRIEI
jgi:hypothetical protein